MRTNEQFVCRREFLAGAAALGAAQATALSAQPKPASALRVMTYNIRYDNPADGRDAWAHRREAMARFIAAEKADLAGFQEVLRHQASDLAERLEDYDWYGVGRDDGKEAGESCPIFYRRERFERLAAGTFWLSTTPDKAGSKGWDAALPRICSWLKLRDKASDRELLHFNTHFDHRGELARQQSAALVRLKIPEIAGKLPAVLTGDFNCTQEAAPYKVLVAAAGSGAAVNDARSASVKEHTGPDSTWNGFREIVPGRTIDFIFVHKLKVLSHQTLDPRIGERFLSDHLPVMAELEA